MRALMVALAAGLVLTACAGQPAPTVTVTQVISASPSASPAPSASESPTPSQSPTAEPPSVPAAKGALDVGGDQAAFASPSGRIWCAVDTTGALCHFPKGIRGIIPPSDDVCPGQGLDVTGVNITGTGPDYFCSGDPSAYPVKGQPAVGWHAKTGYPWVSYESLKLAVLPYGKRLRAAGYVCLSAKEGVTCGNTATRQGFRVSLAGVVLF